MKPTGSDLAVMALLALLGGCASAGPSPLPAGQEAYAVIPERVETSEAAELIRPGDRLAIKVFGEPELSSEAYVVDASGYVQIPLVGEVIAAGQSTRALGAELQRRLGARFVRDPSITVAVTDRPQSTFTVEGDVTTPGVYPAMPSTTLLAAMAQAKSPTKTAKTSDVIVFRTINGQRAGGRFDLVAIRRGRAPDPQIIAGDTIVVVNSAAKSAWRDALAALPLLNTFVLLNNN
jgi:polysaccharide export outer membrane protein